MTQINKEENKATYRNKDLGEKSGRSRLGGVLIVALGIVVVLAMIIGVILYVLVEVYDKNNFSWPAVAVIVWMVMLIILAIHVINLRLKRLWILFLILIAIPLLFFGSCLALVV